MTLSSLRRLLWILVAVAAIAGAAAAVGIIPSRQPTSIETVSGVAGVDSSFRLTTHKGAMLTDADLKGRPFLVFFGFTYCPDICPTTLMELSDRYRVLGENADKLTTLFITVDPERDTQEVLSQYMEAFDPRFVALRGSTDEIDAVTKNYKAFSRKVPVEGGYTMDHTAIVYMMDRQGRFVQSLDPHESESIQLAKLRRLTGN